MLKNNERNNKVGHTCEVGEGKLERTGGHNLGWVLGTRQVTWAFTEFKLSDQLHNKRQHYLAFISSEAITGLWFVVNKPPRYYSESASV